MFSFEKEVEGVEALYSIDYGCYSVKFAKPLTGGMQIRHIAQKIDRLRELGNYGTPKQHLKLFEEICNYVKSRGVTAKIRFRWTFANSIYFNLLSAGLLFVTHRQLSGRCHSEIFD